MINYSVTANTFHGSSCPLITGSIIRLHSKSRRLHRRPNNSTTTQQPTSRPNSLILRPNTFNSMHVCSYINTSNAAAALSRILDPLTVCPPVLLLFRHPPWIKILLVLDTFDKVIPLGHNIQLAIADVVAVPLV